MRKITADYIFPISSEPIKNGAITIDEDGTIIEVSSPLRGTSLGEQKSELEYFEGIICPGFINTHCHLELSHLKGEISENKGMAGFIGEILSKRDLFSEKIIAEAIVNAENELIKNGIVAVGDISNNNNTFHQKSINNLFYHTFIEAFDLNPDRANEVFEKALLLKNDLIKHTHLQHASHHTPSLEGNPRCSIVPHAPYTASDKLFQLISEEAIKNNSIISIHNQESEGENEIFISKSGKLFELFSKMGINMDFIKKTGVNSIQSTLPKFPLSQKILFVHNTFTTQSDIQFIKSQISNLRSQIYFCTCPNANLYIENKLPDYSLFIRENVQMTIGTDSLASNWSLSILDELKTISKYFPEIPLHTLLIWATKNGADFLGLNQLGTIEKGKKPGLNLLKNLDGLKITAETEVIKLV